MFVNAAFESLVNAEYPTNHSRVVLVNGRLFFVAGAIQLGS
jgi:hypothetical protein